jgi:hypothetical protein
VGFSGAGSRERGAGEGGGGMSGTDQIILIVAFTFLAFGIIGRGLTR